MKARIVVSVILSIACLGAGTGLLESSHNQASLMAGEPSWTRVTGHTAFQARDSAGELVYNGKMWILGGWYNSTPGPFPHDVWSSADGVNWTCATPAAPWVHGDLPTTMVYDNKMWIMGGWSKGRLPGASASNQVWYSTDGAAWTQTTAAAPWAARCGAAGAVFQGKMWVLGGIKNYFDSSTTLNDVWSSSDGIHWDAATRNAPWSPRAFHQVLAFDNKLWVIGGGSYTPTLSTTNDVWNSSDGVNWTKVTEHAPWNPRMWFSAEVYNNRMWIVGGLGDAQHWVQPDVWSSADGANWTQLKTDATWIPRHETSTYVFQNKLWVVGGFVGGSEPGGVANDVWRLDGVAAP